MKASSQESPKTRPTYGALIRPVYWVPCGDAHDRITALIVLVADMQSAEIESPAVRCLLAKEKLQAMLGAVDGAAVYGLLREAGMVLGQQLRDGALLREIASPFVRIAMGSVLTVRGFTEQQMWSAAVQMVSALGSVEQVDVIDETVGKAVSRRG